MQTRAIEFRRASERALTDPDLVRALSKVGSGFVNKRRLAVEALPEFDEIREAAVRMKARVLEHLDHYLEQYEREVRARGGTVHWALDDAEARALITSICRSSGIKLLVKGKSMVSEEIALNPALIKAGIEVVETDLGEYILQLAEEPPSHIIAPAIHKNREEIVELFHRHHGPRGHPQVTERRALVAQAREVLREQFLAADGGMTGANFLIAESGQHLLVTNEGNGDLCSSLPPVLIVVAGIEKIVPTAADALAMTRLLSRSATGQHISNYTSFYGGPVRPGEGRGPKEFHVVLVDNGRSRMLSGEFRPMLRCIRCGACMNHCPVYNAVGGHSYGSVYVGPMGAVITPQIVGLEEAPDLPQACTLNGRCAEVCPMKIPLPDLLRRHRRRQHREGINSTTARWGLKFWRFLTLRPGLYRGFFSLAVKAARLFGRGGRVRFAPGAGGWRLSRELPVPERRQTLNKLWSGRR